MRSAAVAAAALLALAVGTAGCGSGDPAAPAGGARFEARADRIARDWPDVGPVPGRHADLLPLEAAEHPSGAAGPALTLRVGHGACVSDWGARVRETDRLVVVAGWEKPKDVDVCTDQLLVDPVTVRLRNAVGDRTVVDAATGERLAVR
ncbi:hypothetical protein ABT112_08785 [Streptomyces sp. NPDC002055]|uniref:hypothetical protein n=1 Tax=Streptomyces sp. NPDC002055 TaxID=3154534 RepID=UPI003319807E